VLVKLTHACMKFMAERDVVGSAGHAIDQTWGNIHNN
jgi:hypothetical protein